MYTNYFIFFFSVVTLYIHLRRFFLKFLKNRPSNELANLLKMDTENGIVSDLRLPSSRSNGGAGVVLMSLPLAWDNVGVASQVAQRMLEFDQPRVEREGTLKKCIFHVVDLSVLFRLSP